MTAAIKAHVPGALFTDSNTFEGPVEHDGVISALRYVKCGYIITGPDGSEVKTGYPVKHLSWTSDTKLGPFKGDIDFRMGLVQPKKPAAAAKTVAPIKSGSDSDGGGPMDWGDDY